MQKILEHYTVSLDKALYAKDPVSSDIGKDILRESVKILAREGLEAFTFKKLATAMSSTETTVYRYFNNKHQLVMYLSSWYWTQLEWKIVFATANIPDPKEQLLRVVEVLSEKAHHDPRSSIVNEELVQKIVTRDAFKVFEISWESDAQKKGYYKAFQDLNDRIADIIHRCDKTYKFSRALATTLVETAQRQMCFRNDLPHLTDVGKSEKQTQEFLNSLVYNITK